MAAQPVRSLQPVVLCVDDDSIILDLAQRVLEKRGYRVLTAACGHEALEVLQGNRIDIVVLDYDMPGMKGHELAAQCKSFNPNIPVIMQSGTPDLPEAVTKSADAFIVKGSDINLLLSTISTLIKSNGHQGNGKGLNIVLPA